MQLFNQNIKAIICDYDFTLIDSSQGVYEYVKSIFKEMGLSQPSFQDVCKTIGHSLTNTFTLLTKNKNESIRQQYKKRFLAHIEKDISILTFRTEFLPGAKEFIQCAKDKQLQLAIVTSKSRYALCDSLTHLKVIHDFAFLQGHDDVAKPKPDPEGIFNTLQYLALKPTEVIFIGDSDIDAKAAECAGIHFIGVTTGHTNRDMLEKYPHLAIYQGLHQFTELMRA